MSNMLPIPDEIIEQPSSLVQILSMSSWESLSNDQRSKLLNLLPKSFKETDKQDTVRSLLSGSNLTAFSSISTLCHSCNPVLDLICKLESGYYSAEACFARKCVRQATKVRSRYLRSCYYHALLKEVIVSQQCHISAVKFMQCFELARQVPTDSTSNEILSAIEKSSTGFYNRILHENKQNIMKNYNFQQKDLLSSDSDSDDLLHNGFSKTSFTDVSPFVASNRIKEMLIQHKRRRRVKVNTPDLNTHGIKLLEVYARTYGTQKKNTGLLRKRRQVENPNYSRQGKMKSNRIKDFRKEKKSFYFKEKRTITTPSCYFVLLRDVIHLTSDKTTQSICLLIGDWLASAEATRFDWTDNFSSSDELVQSALNFLKKVQVTESNSSPLVVNENKMWIWNSSLNKDKETVLLETLCKEWFEQLSDDLILSTYIQNNENSFHMQERRRFMYAHQAFVYNINGKRYPVPPVKGTVGPIKEGKVAREHVLLQSERPSQVTLLALTRDAVARLPAGQGTRSDICLLLQQSQYLSSGVTESQISNAVGGALDRLHYEDDPCVVYHASAKVWIYLHGDRSPEELERIHAENLEAPKRKKQRTVKKSKLKSNELKKKSRKKNCEENPLESKEPTPLLPSSIKSEVASSEVKDLSASNGEFHLTGKEGSTNKASSIKGSTRTIHVSQKQLLEMTRSLMKSGPGGDANEVLISHAIKNMENKQSKQIQTNPQPGLKLVLKPASGDKPIAELVRVLEPSSRSQTSQQMLSAEALRRLTEQLSAMSSRPIKIVQRNVSPNNSTIGSRAIGLVPDPSIKNKPDLSRTGSPSASRAIGINTVNDNPAKTVYISRIASKDVLSEGSSKTSEESKILHVLHKSSKNVARNVEVCASSNSVIPQNLQVISSNSQSALHILSGGKIPIFQASSEVESSQTATFSEKRS